MLSRLVSEREQSARAVDAAFTTHGPVVAGRLVSLLSESTDSTESAESRAAIDKLLAALRRRLERAQAAMTEADRAHTRELGDDAAVRDARDVAKGAVLSLVTSIRMALTSRFGQDFGGRLGASGPAPAVPSDVLNWGQKFHDALASATLPAVDLDSDLTDDVGTFSKEVALRKLGQRLSQLEQALAAVARESREAEVSQAAKDQAIADYDRTFSLTASLLEVLLRFAGETTLADKIRPSSRRPGVTADVEAPTPTPTPADPTPPTT